LTTPKLQQQRLRPLRLQRLNWLRPLRLQPLNWLQPLIGDIHGQMPRDNRRKKVSTLTRIFRKIKPQKSFDPNMLRDKAQNLLSALKKGLKGTKSTPNAP
jgi:hypothetical protein